MISEKALAIALNAEIIPDSILIKNNNIIYTSISAELGISAPRQKTINIFELANICKQKAFLKWFDIYSSIDHEFDKDENSIYLGSSIVINLKNKEDFSNGKYFEAKSEPESVFKAFEYIINLKDKH